MSRQPDRRRSRRVVLVCLTLMLIASTADDDPCEADTGVLAAAVLAPLGVPRLLAPFVRALLFLSKPFDATEPHCAVRPSGVAPTDGPRANGSPTPGSSRESLLSEHI
ncbi:hypothetical protein FKR81_31980 [Lentzea tibetensis]|uniref:Secreted protein n=1 Tax=Lentzea tibetensis TaxID=2591470 RepID=A0A563EKK0_9PSEU|nr:hypothetical protein [Lentzea tibetensis]TWP47579.1 hypothetical protein FKR81_31980 [Lentzea tibetensis]